MKCLNWKTLRNKDPTSMNKAVTFVKNWTLPISMLTGILSYFTYTSLHFLDFTHNFVNNSINIIQPSLVFCMLFVSFSKIKPKDLKPQKWLILPLAIQILSFTTIGILIAIYPDIPLRLAMESFIICMICPTATAASVVTNKLNGNAGIVVNYTCMINLAASLVIPLIVPLIHSNTSEDLSFVSAFYIIIIKVFPLLVFPLALAWFVRYCMPNIHKWIVEKKNLAFYLWAVALAIAIAITTKALVNSGRGLESISEIMIASLLACIIQFAIGRRIGIKYGEKVAATQFLGQKNTVFAIWMGYTFMNPVTALAGGFYSVWHNIVNSYQLYRIRGNRE